MGRRRAFYQRFFCCAGCHKPSWFIKESHLIERGEDESSRVRLISTAPRHPQRDAAAQPRHDSAGIRCSSSSICGGMTWGRRWLTATLVPPPDPGGEQAAAGDSAVVLLLTRPLWGPGRERAPPHDGRALTIPEAIVAHGGEGGESAVSSSGPGAMRSSGRCTCSCSLTRLPLPEVIPRQRCRVAAIGALALCCTQKRLPPRSRSCRWGCRRPRPEPGGPGMTQAWRPWPRRWHGRALHARGLSRRACGAKLRVEQHDIDAGRIPFAQQEIGQELFMLDFTSEQARQRARGEKERWLVCPASTCATSSTGCSAVPTAIRCAAHQYRRSGGAGFRIDNALIDGDA